MKAALIGVVGAIIGAIIAVVGPVHYHEWINGPQEGVFSIEVNAITKEHVSPLLRDQISKYPITIRISQIDGPPVKDLSVLIKSDKNLSDLNEKRNDDNAAAIFKNQDTALSVHIPSLRKNSVIEYQISSIGSAKLEQSHQVASGKLIDELRAEENKAWYKSDIFASIFIIVFLFGLLGVFLYLSSKLADFDLKNDFPKGNYGLLIVFAALMSTMPFLGGFVIALPLILIGALYKKIDTLTEQVDKLSEGK